MKVAWIGVNDIDPTPPDLNSRQVYDEQSINELAVSIQEYGILQPVCVRPNRERYDLIFGMRRLKGAIRAGLQEVPCTIQLADDDRAFLLNTLENLHHRQLSGAERVRAIEKLAATNLGVREIGRRTGFSAATISRWLKIDRRPALKAAVESELLDIGRAMALADAPAGEVSALVADAPALSQEDVKLRVAQLNALRYATPTLALDSRRIMEALRLLGLVTLVAERDRELVEQIRDRACQLLELSLATPSRSAAAGAQSIERVF